MIGALCKGSESDGGSGTGGLFALNRWSIEVGYRYQYSHRHFVGDVEQTDRDAEGSEVINTINLFDVSVTYAFSPRWSITGSLPVSNFKRESSSSGLFTHANGIGDFAVTAQFWAIRPPAEHGHNVAFSFGSKFPTGDCGVRDWDSRTNPPTRVYVDESIQPGDCGYGIIVGTQMYQNFKRSVLFLSGSYLIQPQEQNNTLRGGKNPYALYNSIPDAYLVDGGVAYPVPHIRGLAAKGGLRYEGLKVRDLIGGSLGFRRPGFALSVEPGLQYERGKNTWSVNAPIALYRNRKRSVPDQMTGAAGDAAFADWFLTVGFAHHF